MFPVKHLKTTYKLKTTKAKKMTNRSELLKAITVKQEIIKLETLNGMEVIIKEPTITEYLKIEEIRKKVMAGVLTDKDLIIESCRYAMIDPKFFTDEELENLSSLGMQVLSEIYMKIPTIGMTDDEKKEYEKRLVENLNKQILKTLSKEEEEKK